MERDVELYTMAVKELVSSPVSSPDGGTYHVKNGRIYLGYEPVPVPNFSESSHAWVILH